MERYDYVEHVKDDVREYIESEIDIREYETREELEQYLNDVLFVNDSVTGNASGSYTFNSWKAEENLCHNLDLLGEALSEFGSDPKKIMESPESCDVTIRCYLLPRVIEEVLDEMWEEKEDEV